MAVRENGLIDVYNIIEKYQNAKKRLESDTEVSKQNKELITRFLDDCQIGKTIIGRAKKQIKPNRLIKYLYTLKQIIRFVKKDFKAVTQKDMEKLIGNINNNTLSYVDSNGNTVNLKYTEWTRRDFKVTIKKFYKWLYGDNKEYPSLVSWIDTHIEPSDPPALNLSEIEKIVSFARDEMRKAMAWILFETGARASEFLNIRLRHVTDKGNYYLIRIEFSKTFKRTIPIYEGQKYLRDWISIHPQRYDSESQLFPTSYAAFRKWISRISKRSIGKECHPHIFRHSYATWLAGKKVGRYQMCKLMGWAMSSDMPDRYIDRCGVLEEEAIEAIRGDELTKAQSVNSDLSKQLATLQFKFNQLSEQLEQKKDADNFLEKLISDGSVKQLLCQKIKELGLESQFRQL